MRACASACCCCCVCVCTRRLLLCQNAKKCHSVQRARAQSLRDATQRDARSSSIQYPPIGERIGGRSVLFSLVAARRSLRIPCVQYSVLYMGRIIVLCAGA